MAVTQPSAVRGTVRKGLEVSVAELEKFFPGTPREILDETQRLLKAVVPGLLTEASCIKWGEPEQRRFSELTEQSVKIVDSPIVQTCLRHTARLRILLSEIGDALNGSPEGFLRRKADPRREYEERKAEIAQLRQILNTDLPEAANCQTALTSLTAEFEQLERELHARSLSARYLADTLPEAEKPRIVQALMDRSLSLMQTVANIRQGMLMREQVANSFARLTSSIQNALLNELPVWIESVTFAFQQSSQTPTELYGLKTRLEGILQRLK